MKRRINPRTHFKISLNIFKILSILLILVFILLSPTALFKSIKINKINCQTQFGSCSEDLISLLNLTVGRDLKFSREYLNNILVNDISVNNFLIKYKIPSTIDVEVNLKKPNMAIKATNGLYYLLDKNGLIVAVVNETGLPYLLSQDLEYRVGSELDVKNKFAVNIYEYLIYLFSIKEAKVEADSLIVITNDGPKIIFPLEGDVKVLVGSLKLIFSRLNDGAEGIRMNDISEIDLRFKNAILRK